MVDLIALPTDFSDAGKRAFQHALRLAVEFRCGLDLLHVRDPHDDAEWGKFPHVRETLEAWGMLPPGSAVADIAKTLGVNVRKVDVRDFDPVDGIAHYLTEHQTDLLIMATHGRVGLNSWLSGSVSARVGKRTHIPTLLFGPAARAFVDPKSGALNLSRIAAPVDHDPDPDLAIQSIGALLEGLGGTMTLFHAGDQAPRVTNAEGRALEVDLRDEVPVAAILAESAKADLLAMPTAGREGFLDALRGSTTERVVHEAKCPVLTLHVADD